MTIIKKKLLQCAIGITLLFSTCIGHVAADNSSRKTVWKPQKTIPLNYIAEQSYGHRAYIKMIALYNGLDPDQKAPKGSIINTPELPELFKDIGLIPQYETQFKRVFFVMKQSPPFLIEYLTILKKAEKDAVQVELPDNISEPLALCASMLEKTVNEMEQMTQQTGNTPKMMLRQFTNAAHLLRRVSEGSRVHYKDIDMIEQHFAHAFANAVAWSKE